MQVFKIGDVYSRDNGQAFSPDGRYVVVPAWVGEYWCADTRTGRVCNVSSFSPWICAGVGFIADGSLVLSVGEYVDVYPMPGRAATGLGAFVRPRRRLGDGSGVVSTTDGRTVYASCYVRDRWALTAWDGTTFAPRPVFGRHPGFMRILAVSGDGGRLAGMIELNHGERHEVRVWDVPAAGRPRMRARIALTVRAQAVALSADGARLATADRHRVRVWDAATGSEVRHYNHGGKAANAVAFSPTQPLLASGGNDGVVMLGDGVGTDRRRLDWKIGPIVGLAFSPDGLRCAAVAKRKIVVWDVDE